MLTPPLQTRLAGLHPEAAERLAELGRIAPSVTDSHLLGLCSDYLKALQIGQPWQPPVPPSARERVFLDFTEQFTTAVSGMQDEQVTALLAYASADEVYNFVNALYVVDMSNRLELVMGRVLA